LRTFLLIALCCSPYAAPSFAAPIHYAATAHAIATFTTSDNRFAWWPFEAPVSFSFDSDTNALAIETLDLRNRYYDWPGGGAPAYSLPPLELTLNPLTSLYGLPGAGGTRAFDLAGSPFRATFFQFAGLRWVFGLWTLDPWGSGGMPIDAELLPPARGNDDYALRLVTIGIPEPSAWLLAVLLLPVPGSRLTRRGQVELSKNAYAAR
jgi:hypothetical protein